MWGWDMPRVGHTLDLQELSLPLSELPLPDGGSSAGGSVGVVVGANLERSQASCSSEKGGVVLIAVPEGRRKICGSRETLTAKNS